MTTDTDPLNETDNSTPRRGPSRVWYLVALAILLATAGVFVAAVVGARKASWAVIEAMPRLIAPTPTSDGAVVELPAGGAYVVYYENLGTHEGRTFDRPRTQVWTTPTLASMSCEVTPAGGGEPLEVRLLGQTGDEPAALDADRDTAVIYGGSERQGVGVWSVAVPEAGRYRFDIAYRDAVRLDAQAVEVPPELSRGEQAQMRFADVEQHERDRAEAQARLALATLEPVDVLFAVGQDPTGGSYFNVAGLKGAAALLAFGFTAWAIITLVTLMLRTGSVTERGKLEDVQRGVRAG